MPTQDAADSQKAEAASRLQGIHPRRIEIPPDGDGGSGSRSVARKRCGKGKVPALRRVTTVKNTQAEYQSPAWTRDEKQHTGACYISTSGRFRTIIDFTSLFAVMFCTIMVPYDMCFEPPKGKIMTGVDIAIEFFFISEMCMNFFTSYFDESGEEVTKFTQMAINYVKGWFIIDISSSVPAETAITIATAMAQGTGDSESSMGALTQLKIIRILRLTKLLRLAKMAQILETLEFNFPALAVVIGLFRLGFTMMIVAHLNACIFYWIGRQNIGNSWISKYMFGCCDTSITLFDAQDYGANGTDCFDPSLLPGTDTMYVDAVYWSLTTLATVGYGDITPCNEMEQLYTAAAMVIGSAMFAYIVGSISTVAMQTNGQELQKRSKILQLQEYLALRQVPKELADKILFQCIHKWKNTVFDEQRLLQEFNPKMKRLVVDIIVGNVPARVPLIEGFHNEDFKTDQEEVSCFNELSYDMYIIRQGKARLSMQDNDNQEVFIHEISHVQTAQDSSMKSNSKSFQEATMPAYINELGMLAKEPCREKVVAVGFIDLFVLRRQCFEKVVELYTEAALKPFIDARIAKERERLSALVASKARQEQMIDDKVGPGVGGGSSHRGEKDASPLGSPLSSPLSRRRSLMMSPILPGASKSSSNTTLTELKQLVEQVSNRQAWCQQSMNLIMEASYDGGLQPSDVEVSLEGGAAAKAHKRKLLPMTGDRTSGSRFNGGGARTPLSPRSLASRQGMSPPSSGGKAGHDISQSHWV